MRCGNHATQHALRTCVTGVHARETRTLGCVAHDAATRVRALLMDRRMASSIDLRSGRAVVRDLVACITTLPAAAVIGACLFLPHTRTCGARIDTPVESGSWIIIAPLVVLGCLPVLWRWVPRARHAMPELVLSFTTIVLGLFVVTIPAAIFLVWGYSKRSFRGELLVAMCSAACVMVWLVAYPITTMFAHWLPAATWTWWAATVELVGLIAWASAATARPADDDDRPHVIDRLFS